MKLLPRFILIWAAFFFLGSVLVYDCVKIGDAIVAKITP